MKDKLAMSYERLVHIKNAIQQIELFTGNTNLDIFLNDRLLSSAVLFQFSIIGEAINHIDAGLLEKYDYPWYRARAFRNLISHEYFQIKLEAIWEIIKNDLTDLKNIINKIIKNEF